MYAAHFLPISYFIFGGLYTWLFLIATCASKVDKCKFNTWQSWQSFHNIHLLNIQLSINYLTVVFDNLQNETKWNLTNKAYYFFMLSLPFC